MISAIRYEYAKLFTRNSIIAFFIIIIAPLYFTFQGTSEYKIFCEYKSDFLAAEKNKIAFYLNYEQYGAAGIRVILEPSLLSVFFNRCDFTRDLEARIDASEIISLYNGRKGKKAFSMNGRFGDLNQSITIFGTLIMMIMGFLTFPNQFQIEYFKKGRYIKTIFARELLLNIFFILLLVINYAFAKVLGITFHPDDNLCFMWYGLGALLLLDASFLAGLLIRVICKYKRNALHFLMVSWFIFFFVFPEIGQIYRSMKTNLLPSEEKLNIEKMKKLLNTEFNNKQSISDYLSKHNTNSKPEFREFQKLLKGLFEDYINNGYMLNKKKEDDFLRKVKRDIDIFSFIYTLYPMDFLNYISAEASGKGYAAYVDFFKHAVKLRDQFMQFYGQKRYETIDDVKQMGVESFIKNSENIYRSKSRLPENFVVGTVFMFFYLVILFGFSCYRKREKISTLKTSEIIESSRHGQILFLLVNKKKQVEIVNALKQGNRSFLHRASHLIMDKEVTGRLFINYACREKKIKRYKVMENLELLGMQEKDLQKKLSNYTDENKRKLICALVFAEENEAIIIDDFIKGASYEFEKQFLTLVAREADMDRKIIYLGSEIYTPSSSLIKFDIKIKIFQPFHLDPSEISLR